MSSAFLAWKLLWLAGTSTTTGKVWFLGHTIELNGGISSHIVILFRNKGNSITFEAPAGLAMKEGDAVRVRYSKSDPEDARVDSFTRIWGDLLVYAIWPVLIVFVIYLIPDSLDSPIPSDCRISISKKNLIQVIRRDAVASFVA